MKASQFATLATFILPALAEVYDIKLKFHSDNTDVDGQYLSSMHEGAAINYFFLGEQGEVYSYDSDKETITLQTGAIELLLNSAGEFLGVTAAEPQQVKFADDVLSVAGNSEFYAAKDVNDPYNYSKKSYAVLSLGSASGSIKGQIKKESVAGPSGLASANSTVTTSTSKSEVVVTITDCPESVTNCPARVSTVTSGAESTTPAQVSTVANAAAKGVVGGAAAGVAAIAALML